MQDNIGNYSRLIRFEYIFIWKADGARDRYDFHEESQCDNCGNYLRYSIRGFEYPVGCLNCNDCECNVGVFIKSPEVDVNYYEFDYDEDDKDIPVICGEKTSVLHPKHLPVNLQKDSKRILVFIFYSSVVILIIGYLKCLIYCDKLFCILPYLWKGSNWLLR